MPGWRVWGSEYWPPFPKGRPGLPEAESGSVGGRGAVRQGLQGPGDG